jgi:type II secretory pathway component PulF
MQGFAYEAVDAGGRRIRGWAEAANADALGRTLEASGLLVLEAVERPPPAAGGRLFGRRRQVLETTRALAALLGVGMPLVRALEAAEQLAGRDAPPVLRHVRADVQRGVALSEALARHPGWFSPLYVGGVRAGERAGDLEGAFRRLAEQLERDHHLRERITTAMLYPALLGLVGAGTIAVLLLFVLPKFAELFEGTGVAMPASTATLFTVAGFLGRTWPLLLGGLVVGGVGLAVARRTERGQRALGTALLALPLVGTLRRRALGARFARLTGVLLGGGAPLVSALDDARASIDDPLARDETARVRDRVREGSALRQALAESTLFPPALAQLVAVGEEAGRLREFLVKAAEVLEEQTERAVQRLVVAAEPAMIVCFGAIVALIAFALLQAIYGVNAGALR